MARAPIISGVMSAHCYSPPPSKLHLSCREFIRKIPSSIFSEHTSFISVPKISIAPAFTSFSLSPKRTSFLVKQTSYGMGRGLSSGIVSFSADGVSAASTKESPSKEEDREILVQHILVPEDQLKLLVELQMRIIQEGVDLSDLATEHSICPSKEEGGMLGWVRKGQMVPEFEEAAFSAPLNKPVRCKTKFGWHLVQVLSERQGGSLKNIEPEELHLKMQEENFTNDAQLMDVREPDEVDIASLPGFKIYPLRQFGNWGPTVTTDLDPLKDTYVLCHHGMRSLQVATWLQTQGFKRVYNISGGIHKYSQTVDSSIPTY
ncbi:hypothetical protein SUGI_1109680 [Cryptomeria japonica]|uniref:rhodanese-like/PpiC domain-containing protein 12, chloroplastic n=1 Tax=Cryptomeria japonica TaxID=3369 RepID=UPI002414AB87|nr:rhodanese-like/PpiC domain-containing protein 12, chloroplastic [Cryptomeria japonica]GLJ52169.1 hypothetical protein SUGI_1109680 [Cryptomeria japonica]